MVFGKRKGGDSRARAARARKGHGKRRARGLTGAGTTYKGHKARRTKPSWW
jgi:hypothetical protein